jgi:hypothetical protein
MFPRGLCFVGRRGGRARIALAMSCGLVFDGFPSGHSLVRGDCRGFDLRAHGAHVGNRLALGGLPYANLSLRRPERRERKNNPPPVYTRS